MRTNLDFTAPLSQCPSAGELVSSAAAATVLCVFLYFLCRMERII